MSRRLCSRAPETTISLVEAIHLHSRRANRRSLPSPASALPQFVGVSRGRSPYLRQSASDFAGGGARPGRARPAVAAALPLDRREDLVQQAGSVGQVEV